MTENKQNQSHLALIPVLATWVIRSKTCASSMTMTFLHCLSTAPHDGGEFNMVLSELRTQKRVRFIEYSDATRL